MQLYFTDRDSPITKDASNWAMDDEIYYDMDLMPETHVLAAAYAEGAPAPATPERSGGRDELTGGGKRSASRHPPQIWTYERTIEGGQALSAASSRSPDTSTRTSTGRTTARSAAAASRGPASAPTSMNFF